MAVERMLAYMRGRGQGRHKNGIGSGGKRRRTCSRRVKQRRAKPHNYCPVFAVIKMAAVRSPVLYPPSPKQSAVGLRKGFLDIAALQEQELQYNQWVSLNPSLWYSFWGHMGTVLCLLFVLRILSF